MRYSLKATQKVALSDKELELLKGITKLIRGGVRPGEYCIIRVSDVIAGFREGVMLHVMKSYQRTEMAVMCSGEESWTIEKQHRRNGF